MITSGNLLCGMMGLILLFHGRPVPASWLVFIAVFFD
ncbi:MAG: CDP-diacylglycerol--serine O-phosphatidyltransferase, partial [Synergistales bacterium]|nr:CDP-diacylglycerol--serine O-phosphatidyltransferase [Synergistales bacterium]